MKKTTSTAAAKVPVVHRVANPSRQKLEQQVMTLQAEVTAKHSPAKKSKASKSSKHTTRKWSPDEDVALCSARAVAESLRITLGTRVSDQDVLALYWRTAVDPGSGASITDTLKAAHEHGVGGHYPVAWQPAAALDPGRSVLLGTRLANGETHAMVTYDWLFWSWGEPHYPAAFEDCVIEEAWAVSWL